MHMSNRSVVDYDRWRHVWFFLSSRATTEFSNELWLDFIPPGHSTDWIAEKIGHWSSRSEFTHDFGVVHRDMFSSFERNHGTVATFELMLWTEFIFIQGGADRAAESMWCSVCTKRYHSNRRMGLGVSPVAEVFPGIIEVGSVFVLEARVFDDRFRAFSESDTAEVKPAAVLSPDFDRDALRATLKLISKCNLFCSIWERKMSGASSEDLSQLYATVKAASSIEFGSGVSTELLGFPGEWAPLRILKRRGNPKIKA